MMKLSEAILIGDSCKKADPWVWLSPDGSCGCAFGGALLATGVKGVPELSGSYYGMLAESKVVKQRWPWVTSEILVRISTMYFAVTHGTMTIEQLCDKVREIEDAIEAKTAREVDEAVEQAREEVCV